jgi:hypothetical protein
MLVAPSTGNRENAMNNAIRELAPDELALVSGGTRHLAIVTSDPLKGSNNTTGGPGGGESTLVSNLIAAIEASEEKIIQNMGSQ